MTVIRLALLVLIVLAIGITLDTAMTKISYDAANLVDPSW